uniref:Neuromodulin C-terminal domain-containing protein n=1 Tax=Cebus imitator TaxID=2715852 RepID=A0A2K5QTU8_CEBIM
QKIEQDGTKPEDKAHKAATKIQASFRGHITRKKLKGEKKDDAQAAEADASKKKDEAPVADGVEKKGEGPTTTEAAPGTGSKPDETGKAGETPSEEEKGEGDAATEQAIPQAPESSEEKASSAETENATTASTDNLPSSKAEDAPAKEEPKQAHVPAVVTAAAATTPATEDAAPPTETGESSQAKEKVGEQPRGSDTVDGWGGELLFKMPGDLGYQGRGNSLDSVFQKSREAGLNFPKWQD